MFTLRKRFKFDSAHRLHFLPPSHKCSNLHGHTYYLQVEVAVDDFEGNMVLDFGKFSQLVQSSVIDQFDHAVLVAEGDLSLKEACRLLQTRYISLPIPATTAEHLAAYIAKLLKLKLDLFIKDLSYVRVVLYETPNSSVAYTLR